MAVPSTNGKEKEENESLIRDMMVGTDMNVSASSSDESGSDSESDDGDLSSKASGAVESQSAQSGGIRIMSKCSSSVFKILVTGKIYSHDQPWSAPRIMNCSGSGFVVEQGGKNYIVTNAHVVEGAEITRVRQARGKKDYSSKVLWVDHCCDLAVMELPESLQSRVSPLKVEVIPPKLGQDVYVVGFPQMGEEICITSGGVSRCELDEYVHSGWEGLQYGVDAAINPGNSGGPALNENGDLLGVAFQGADNNQGFIIPTEVLKHMLGDFNAKRAGGFPDLGIEWQKMTNRYMRSQMASGNKGVLVTKIHPLSNAMGQLLANDIITDVDECKVSSEGRVRVGSRWIDFEYLISRKSIGDDIKLGLIRDGAPIEVSVNLAHNVDRTELVQWQHEKQPTYFIYFGMVFKLLTQNDGICVDSSFEKKDDTDQLIIINRVLNSKYTKGYEDVDDDVVVEVNGTKIKNMSDVVGVLAGKEKDSIKIKFKSGQFVVVPNILKSENAMRRHFKILQQYDIRRACSRDMHTQLEAVGIIGVNSTAADSQQTASAGLGAMTEGQVTFFNAVNDIGRRAQLGGINMGDSVESSSDGGSWHEGDESLDDSASKSSSSSSSVEIDDSSNRSRGHKRSRSPVDDANKENRLEQAGHDDKRARGLGC